MLCHPAGACRQACWWIPCCAGNPVLQRVGTGARHVLCIAGILAVLGLRAGSRAALPIMIRVMSRCAHMCRRQGGVLHAIRTAAQSKGFWAVCLQGRRQLGYVWEGMVRQVMGGYGTAGCGMEGRVPAARVSAGDALWMCVGPCDQVSHCVNTISQHWSMACPQV